MERKSEASRKERVRELVQEHASEEQKRRRRREHDSFAGHQRKLEGERLEVQIEEQRGDQKPRDVHANIDARDPHHADRSRDHADGSSSASWLSRSTVRAVSCSSAVPTRRLWRATFALNSATAASSSD